MRRRDFITLLSGATAWPLVARAQTPARIQRIGILSAFAEDDPEARGNIAVFRRALEKLGWTEDANARIDYRWGGADAARIRAYALELLGLNPSNTAGLLTVMMPCREWQLILCSAARL